MSFDGILVTGFQPFLSEKINPSQKLALDLASKYSFVESLILPVEFENSFKCLQQYLQKQAVYPKYLIMLGQASGRKNICLEKIALNWQFSQYADEVGFLPETGKIDRTAELALMSKLPIEEIYRNLKIKNQNFEISFSAGTFVCNDLYFRVLKNYPKILSLFIHVPLLPEQIKSKEFSYSMNYEDQLSCLSQTIEFLTGQ